MSDRIKGDPYTTSHGIAYQKCKDDLRILFGLGESDSVNKSIESVKSAMNKLAKLHNALIDEHEKGEQ